MQIPFLRHTKNPLNAEVGVLMLHFGNDLIAKRVKFPKAAKIKGRQPKSTAFRISVVIAAYKSSFATMVRCPKKEQIFVFSMIKK